MMCDDVSSPVRGDGPTLRLLSRLSRGFGLGEPARDRSCEGNGAAFPVIGAAEAQA
jgi:hypothetical protein